jgi:hypothetical protein
MANESSKTVPPYVTWGVFKGTMDTLAGSTVPSGPLDRRVLHWLSGADHGALMSALRFLGLADSENRATGSYDDLIDTLHVGAAPERFREKLMELLDEKYKTILERVSLERGTITELEKAFREEMSVAPGQMMTKTIRFFVKAYTEAGFNLMSPHITKPKPKKRAPKSTAKSITSEKTGKSKGAQNPEVKKEETVRDVVPSGFSRLPIPGMDGAFIQYPKDLTEQQCTVLDGAVQMLRVYVKYIRSGEVTVQDLMEGLKK